MKISALATLLIAATAHAADTKQHVRKAQGDDIAEQLTEAIEVRDDTSCSICYIMMCILYRMLCVSYNININHSYHLSYLYSHQYHIYLDLIIVTV